MTAVDVNVSVVSSDGVSIGKQSADGAVHPSRNDLAPMTAGFSSQ